LRKLAPLVCAGIHIPAERIADQLTIAGRIARVIHCVRGTQAMLGASLRRLFKSVPHERKPKRMLNAVVRKRNEGRHEPHRPMHPKSHLLASTPVTVLPEIGPHHPLHATEFGWRASRSRHDETAS
jgi:hypothetical protein